MAKAMAKKQTTELWTDDRPDYLKDTGRGQEGVGLEDLTLPRLDVIQDLSPQRKKNDPAYIEGADSGMLFNTVTQELYGEEVVFVPVFFKKEWLIWKNQDAGGGLQGVFDTKDEAIQAFADEGFSSNEYEIVDHANHFGLLLKDDGTFEQIVVSMSKSKMKASRQLNTLVKMAGGDRFSRAYKVIAYEDQNKQGQSYYNIKVKQLGFVSEPVYKAAEEMYESLASAGKVAYEAPAAGSSEEDEEF